MRNVALLIGLCLLLMVGCSRPSSTAPPVHQPAPQPVEPVPPPVAPRLQEPASVPPSYQVGFYSPADLFAGRSQPLRTYTMEGPMSGLALAPDGQTVLRYAADPFMPPTPPSLYHLPTGQATAVPLPDDEHFLAHFLPDGRLVVVGRTQVLLGKPTELEPIAQGGARSAWLSPSGNLLALWGYEASLRILDLTTGKVVKAEETYRPLGQDGGILAAWAPDGTRFTATDTAMPHEQQQPPLRYSLTTTYVVDARTGSRVAEHRDLTVNAWLADGTWLGTRGPNTHEGPPTHHLTSEGKPIKQLPRFSYNPSPDGQYVLGDGGLVEVATGKAADIPPGEWRIWAPNGELIIFIRQGEG